MMSHEIEERSAVIKVAHEWIGTPFVNGARIKGSGVDCAMLIQEIYIAAGIIGEQYPGRYSSTWHLHRDEERYLAWAEHLAVEVEVWQPGDVGIWKFGRCYSHGAIFVDAEHVIHAFASHREVTKDLVRMGSLSVMKGGALRPVRYFDPWAKRRAG
jgi:cell wall-associated NlpC family hydrolase